MSAGAGKPTALHPQLRMTWKRAMKIERIARLSLQLGPTGAPLSNVEIANIMGGISPQTVVLIRQLPAFHAKMIELSTGLLSDHDRELREDTANARAELKSMVPNALNVIKQAVLDRRNPNLQFKAAMEILNRDGNMAPVSRTNITLETKPNMQIDAGVAANIMTLLASAPARADAKGVALSGDPAFTISAAQSLVQGSAVTNTGVEAEALLDQFDTKDLKPN